MKSSPRRVMGSILGIVSLGAAIAFVDSPVRSLAQEKAGPDPAGLARARESIKMLDDLYKSAVVAITEKYVEQQSDTPAAAVAKKVFEAMHKKGWHTARLVDATGKPRKVDNLPKTDWEKKAAAEIKGGKAYLEEIGEKDGKPVLRAATVVPAVMNACTICYGGKEGRVLGAIIYELPIMYAQASRAELRSFPVGGETAQPFVAGRHQRIGDRPGERQVGVSPENA